MVELSVVIPVYNSEACLEELYRQLADVLRGHEHEVIFVNDQSADHSWSVIKRLCEKDASVTGISLRKNVGQDNAVLCGLRRARGNFVVIMDDDLQHSPYDIIARCTIGVGPLIWTSSMRISLFSGRPFGKEQEVGSTANWPRL